MLNVEEEKKERKISPRLAGAKMLITITQTHVSLQPFRHNITEDAVECERRR